MKRYDPIQRFDQGGTGRADMEECADGDYVKHEEAASLILELEARIKTLKSALEAITRNQSEKEGMEGICPFGCDAPWIAMSALDRWNVEGVEVWKP